MKGNCTNQSVHRLLPQLDETNKSQFQWSTNPTRPENTSPSSIDKTIMAKEQSCDVNSCQSDCCQRQQPCKTNKQEQNIALKCPHPTNRSLFQLNKTNKTQVQMDTSTTGPTSSSPFSIGKTHICNPCPPAHHSPSEGLSTKTTIENESTKVIKDNTSEKLNLILDLFNNDNEKVIKFIKYFKEYPDIIQLLEDFVNTITSKEHKEKINVKLEEITDNSCGVNCKWIFDEKTRTLFIKGEGAMKNYDFDEEQDKSSVPWNPFNEEIKHVVIDQRITTIGNYAFCNCTSLSSITIPDIVTTIESGAFFKCTSLKTITLPESVTIIGDKAFENCTSMTSLTLPENLKVIGSRAFYGCSQMKLLTLPNGELSVGESAFDECPGIIFFDENYTRKYQV